MAHPSPHEHLSAMITELISGKITDNRRTELFRILEKDPDALKYYIEFITTWALLDECSDELDTELVREEFNTDFWNALAEDEKAAPAIEGYKEEPDRELITKVEHRPTERKISRVSVFSLIASAAAVLFVVIYARFVPVPQSIEVATLTNGMHTKWAEMDSLMQPGTRLYADGMPLLLREGLAEVVFDSNARMTIEAPAEFQIFAGDRVKLRYGKVYATVPQEAIGFTVTTENAEVIDLGTEFGVKADIGGDTYLHVIDGMTRLVTRGESDRISVDVRGGSAKKVSGVTAVISEIVCDTRLFVRAFDPANNITWRRKPALDMAELVDMGDGTETGDALRRIHPAKGYTHEQNVVVYAPRTGYVPLEKNPFVDGIFVPDGRDNQVISTRGDTFGERPLSSGLFYADLLANPAPGLYKTSLRGGTIEFNGRIYGQGHLPCLVMHSNLGVTFDLDAIRRQYTGSITRFVSQIGLADFNEPHPCNADLWVLVDGEVRYARKNLREKGVLFDVVVELQDSNRFLTLAVTDGGDADNPESGYTRAIACDWGVFAEPVLEIE